jgi:hypothetical protein
MSEMNLFNTENERNEQKVEFLGEFDTKIENNFWCLSGAQMGPVRQTNLNKKNLMQVYL